MATDEETYGYLHFKGDKAFAYCIYHIESMKLAKITNYGEYLEKFPPTHEVEEGIIFALKIHEDYDYMF